MKCKNCGMEYSGPPENFPKSGLCPMCAMTPAERETERKWREKADQCQREREEADREAQADQSRQDMGVL